MGHGAESMAQRAWSQEQRAWIGPPVPLSDKGFSWNPFFLSLKACLSEGRRIPNEPGNKFNAYESVFN
ncbi:hypothetical protein DDZ16_08860 [Marinilabilia rubra]|uniref:Uncharacterized protein n=1 Tax=Marinilabilia rubra TaxID=2162893 RepID=A0A2U2B942_9BACT|nr:hypothetical protein DDZ16_08860 [Marinilabilia rubra]